MFNFILFKKEMKSLWKMLVIFMAILTLYAGVIITMYDPEKMALLDGYVEAMPEFMAAVGMTAGATTLLGFMASYLYGFILLIIPMVFTIICANNLIARYADNNSLYALLAAPIKRSAVALTQTLVLLFGIFALMAYVTLLEIGVAQSCFPGEIDIPQLLLLNFGLLGLHFFIGSICFLCSCLFSDVKNSLTFGAGIPIFAYILQALANMGGNAEKAKYFTFLTLFNPTGIMEAEVMALAGGGILWVSSFLLFATAINIFSKKDLNI